MGKSTIMTVRLASAVSSKLGALARDLKRSKSYLAAEAIASYVDHNAWQIEEIKAGLKEARSGSPGVPHEEVEKWVRSWRTRRPLRRPHPKS